jgi:CHRD domain-containing protein
MKRCLVATLGVVVVWTLAAQTQQSFKTRLSPVPIDAQLAPVITGHGSVSAVLVGTKLTVSGMFEGMRSAATSADLHQSKMTGIRGAVIHEMTASKAMAGNVSGSVDLTPAEVDALRKGLLYVVVHSEGAPDGNLWGWLLK